MRTLYEKEEAPLSKIAMNFGVSVPLIAELLREMGVAIRGKGRPKKKTTEVFTAAPIEEEKPEPETVEIFDWA